MSTIIVALALVGFIVLIVGVLMYVHKKHQKAEGAKKANTP